MMKGIGSFALTAPLVSSIKLGLWQILAGGQQMSNKEMMDTPPPKWNLLQRTLRGVQSPDTLSSSQLCYARVCAKHLRHGLFLTHQSGCPICSWAWQVLRDHFYLKLWWQGTQPRKELNEESHHHTPKCWTAGVEDILLKVARESVSRVGSIFQQTQG